MFLVVLAGDYLNVEVGDQLASPDNTKGELQKSSLRLSLKVGKKLRTSSSKLPKMAEKGIDLKYCVCGSMRQWEDE
jgi:hypothetical protein